MTATDPRRAAQERLDRTGWLRAAVLGANDGLVSTASLILGVAAAGTSEHNILLTGVAGLVAGATSMAAGEYVSVHAQADEEKADQTRLQAPAPNAPPAAPSPLPPPEPRVPHRHFFAGPLHRIVAPGSGSGASPGPPIYARPLQASLASAISFSVGAAAPLLVTLLVSGRALVPSIAAASLLFLALLGFIAADAGGANRLIGTVRVTVWGAMAMAVTAGVGMIFKPLA